MSVQLTDKVIWITGAGKGLGRTIAHGVLSAGATVVATARTLDSLESLREEYPAGRVLVAPGSVATESDVERITSQISSEFAQLDGLVNCAGVSPSFDRSERIGIDTFRAILETNVVGSFICAQQAGRLMLTQGFGSIINVSSIHGQNGYPRISAYAASKGAISALTKTLAVEWADRGVRVNTLAPGYFDTDLSHKLLESSWGDDIRRRTPMGRTGEPDELIGAVTYLLSDSANYTTGSTITVDGGWSAW